MIVSDDSVELIADVFQFVTAANHFQAGGFAAVFTDAGLPDFGIEIYEDFPTGKKEIVNRFVQFVIRPTGTG